MGNRIWGGLKGLFGTPELRVVDPPKERVVVVNSIAPDKLDRIVAHLENAAASVERFATFAADTQKTLQLAVEGDLSGFGARMTSYDQSLDRHARLIDEHGGRIDRWAKKCQEYCNTAIRQIDRNDKLVKRIEALEAEVKELREGRMVAPSIPDTAAPAPAVGIPEPEPVLEMPDAEVLKRADAEKVQQVADIVPPVPLPDNPVRPPRKFNRFRDHSGDPSYNARFAAFNPVSLEFKFLKTYEEARNAVSVAMGKQTSRSRLMIITKLEFCIGLSDQYLDNKTRNRNLRNGNIASEIKSAFKRAILKYTSEGLRGNWIANPLHIVDKFNELGFFPNGTNQED